MNIIEKLIEINVIVPSGQLNKQSARILKSNPDVLQLLNDVTNFIPDESIRAKLFAVRNGITKQPCCLSCGEPMKFNEQTGKFNSFCSNKTGKGCSTTHEQTQSKRIATNIERYGTECAVGLPETQAKIKATSLDRYGVDHAMQLEENRLRMSERPYSQETVEQRKQTNLMKYGATTWAGSQISSDIREIIDDKDALAFLLEGSTISEVADYLGISVSTVSSRISIFGIDHISVGSSYERLITSWLDELGIDYTTNDRTILAGQELDIYIPDHNLAIEVNGVYFHSELKGKGRNYHLNKHQACHQLGIQLIQIWHFELNRNPDMIKAKLMHLLGITSRSVYARKCEIREVSNSDSSTFLNQHHTQANVKSSIRYGLYYNDELVALMTFAKSRYSKVAEYELMRYATSCSVVGGASKLLSHFIKMYHPKGIVSYCDLRWGTGHTYTKLGFTKLESKPSPNYHYFKLSNANRLLSRVQFQKHKLDSVLENFDANISEWENMKANGYDRVWDCGSDTYILE